MISNKKLLFVITEDWFFVSHFLERAEAAIKDGFEVAVATRVSKYEDLLRQKGIAVYPINFSRRGLNPLKELRTALRVRHIIKQFRPTIVHNIALKPVVTGTLGERWAGCLNIVNAPVGMGYVFTSTDTKATLIRPIVKMLVKRLINPPGSRVIIENPDDYDSLISGGFVRSDSLTLIKGAGVNTNLFASTTEPEGPIVVVLIARMLRDKGVGEFVDAARILKPRFPSTRFLLVGTPDDGNPTSFSQTDVNNWQNEALVEWLGHRDDIAHVLQTSHIVCLPSYREGLPKSLIEACSAGRPIVTTDVPGCREVVHEGVNGLLVSPRDHISLATAIETLILDPDMRVRMGRAGRERAITEFSSEIVIRQTLDLYETILKG
jgi:glycosyltransferase involved in cell wall biosynthesis